MHRRLLLLVLWCLVLGLTVSACASPKAAIGPAATARPSTTPTGTSKPAEPIGAGHIHLQPFAKGLDSPVYITYAPGQTNREYVVEQAGRIMVVGMDGTVRAQPFLDIHQLVFAGGERGLLSVAFHPDYAHNGYFFVNYTGADGAVTVARYRVSPDDPYRADPASARTILSVPHPVSNHNGGVLLFCRDGYLYIGIGDGGAGNSANGHRNTTLLREVFRIGVEANTVDPQHAVPTS